MNKAVTEFADDKMQSQAILNKFQNTNLNDLSGTNNCFK